MENEDDRGQMSREAPDIDEEDEIIGSLDRGGCVTESNWMRVDADYGWIVDLFLSSFSREGRRMLDGYRFQKSSIHVIFLFFKENGKFVDIGESRIDWML